MVYQVLVVPVLLYGSECWTMRKEDERSLLTMKMSCLRRMLGVTRLDRIKNEDIRKRVNLPETVVEVIRRRRLTWFVHVSRMSRDRLPTRALHCYIPGRRSRSRPCKKWINNIQEDLNRLQLNMKEAMDIVRDRQKWRHRISTSSSPLGWRASKKKKKSDRWKGTLAYASLQQMNWQRRITYYTWGTRVEPLCWTF